MTDELITLTPEEALTVLKGTEDVHCFLNPATDVLIGADWSRASICELLARSPRIESAGTEARRMKHGLVVFDGSVPCFFETDEKRLAELEIAKAARAK